ncbi:helix-turn-helix transcriptional regulator [Clostridium sp. MB40-C1]|uniref:helix-turn-helix domain-containing protein n=1 Tax=Clostridium sp. MB40-C1 TaxID=3070996 RepID=UPI0027E0EBC4|nr:helix-turn-helix transcriptional regulator [Clostridium sp. MB40-C1]WMJ81758.1 helix-turn-helix transcriptional regulator [Clostridium sp. MB40-C1]
MKDKKTSELLNILNSIDNTSNLNIYVKKVKTTFSNLDFCSYVTSILEEKNIKKSKLIELSNLDRTYAYQILNGTKKPSRNKILQLCIAAKLNIEETQKALTLGNVGQLYPKDPRDSAIMFSINKRLNLIDTNDLLGQLNLDYLDE